MFPWTGKGDIDGDCDIDILDLDGFAQSWGGNIIYPCYHTRCDFDNDLYIGILDLDGFAQMWGKTYCKNHSRYSTTEELLPPTQ